MFIYIQIQLPLKQTDIQLQTFTYSMGTIKVRTTWLKKQELRTTQICARKK